jgi:hypothetical protein
MNKILLKVRSKKKTPQKKEGFGSRLKRRGGDRFMKPGSRAELDLWRHLRHLRHPIWLSSLSLSSNH